MVQLDYWSADGVAGSYCGGVIVADLTIAGGRSRWWQCASGFFSFSFFFVFFCFFVFYFMKWN